MTDLAWWLQNFKHSAFRLETLPEYQVEQEAEWFAEWQRSGKVPELNPENDSWCKLIHEACTAGRRMQRVRLVSTPLTDYERFELATFRDSVAAGEEIRVCHRETWKRLEIETDENPGDFWVFDEQTTVMLNYDAEGRFQGTKDGVSSICIRQRDLALEHSIPLADFLARTTRQ
jgi:hypothetical protein